MSDSKGGERLIMVMAQPENGDGYVFSTAEPARALEQYKQWSARFGAEHVRGNEGFERLVIGAASPPEGDKA